MGTLTIRRTTKYGGSTLDCEVNGVRTEVFQSDVTLPNLFPGLEVIHGGLFLCVLNVKLMGHHKCFAFDRQMQPQTEDFRQVERDLRARLHQIKNWVKSIPVVEEFTIEI